MTMGHESILVHILIKWLYLYAFLLKVKLKGRVVEVLEAHTPIDHVDLDL
jgi:hypothetical protein